MDTTNTKPFPFTGDFLLTGKKPIQIAIIGGSTASKTTLDIAEEVGTLIAQKKGILISGGMGGIMEASCRGAIKAGGMVIGIVPDNLGNAYLSVIIRTEMNHARNVILVRSADAVIAIGGEYGTLSEIAFALKYGIPVFGLNTWDIIGVQSCSSPKEAVTKAFDNITSTQKSTKEDG